MTFKDLLNNVLFEKISKEQQEVGQREMIKVNTVYTRLREYLDNKWNKKENFTKEEIRQKLLEYKRFRELLKEKPFQKAKTKFYKRAEIKNILGKEPEWNIEDYPNRLDYDENDIPVVLQKTPTNLKARAKGDGYNTEDELLLKTYNKYLVEHEYGHLFSWMKNYIETGRIERIPETFDKDKDKSSREEGKADKYAFNNLYRKDRRGLLKKSEFTVEKLKKDTEEFDKMDIDAKELFNEFINKNIPLERKKFLAIKLSEYSKLLYNAGKYKEADNIINILKSIEKENKAKQLKESYFNY